MMQGFIPGAVSMIVCWDFLVIEALLLAEINIQLRKKERKEEGQGGDLEVLSLRTMAQDTLGEWGGNLATITYLFLAYTSMVAYTSKSGEVLSRLVDLPASLSGNLFTLLMALLVLLGGTRITDQVNRWLTASMIGLPTIFLGSPSPLPHLLDKRSIHSFIHSYVYRFIGDHRVCGHLVWWWIISNGDIQLGEGSNNNPGDHLLTRVS